ncbi:hypothetical protein AeMF1_020995 [Aphanomyces euteiches]|nr:hypothetical protein AeMF1_020995 [Aphanomyces euteiches]
MSDHGESSDGTGSDSAWAAEGSDESQYWNDSEAYDSDGKNSEDSDHVVIDPTANATELCATKCCDQNCKAGREKEVANFLASVALISKREKQTCMMTCLALLWKIKKEPDATAPGKKTRVRFTYPIPLVGDVCRATFAECFGVSSPTIDRCRLRIANGFVAAINSTATVVTWFESFAKEVGEVVPVRVRRRTTENGVMKKQVSSNLYTFLTSYMTWQSILHEHERFVAAGVERVRLPSERSFRRILQRECKTILVRSPQANVCDACTVYKNTMSDAQDAEIFAQHVQNARQMRHSYKDDSSKASETFILLTMDYSQNLTLPNAASTPTQWYFLSLVSISVFGVFDFGLSEQTNIVYLEKIGGKGSNEVISMLEKYFHKNSILDGNKSLALYADNCGGQNKNNYTQPSGLQLFVKGHTKNACDRGFGHTRKRSLKTDCWTFDQVVEVVQSSSSSNKCVSLENDDTPFFDYKSVVDEMFSNVQGIQKYQMFRMKSSDPGVVECRRHPHDEPKRFDLRRTYDGIVVGSDRARVLWEQVQAIDRPRFNPEKARDLYKKIRPYVPQEFRNCGYYDKPTEVVTEAAKRVKRARAQQ